jgi:hypothetical protein
MLDAPSHAYLAYRPGVPLVTAVWQAGELVADRPRQTGMRHVPSIPSLPE